MKNLQITSRIVCEDIRQEKTNKYILVGVISGDILVQELPGMIALSIYLEGVARESGSVRIRVSGPGEGQGVMGASFKLQDGNRVTLTFPTVGLALECEGTLKLEISEGDDEDWEPLVEKKVIKTEGLWTLAPIVSPPPSGQSPSDAQESS